jgi:ribonuclease P protein component
MPGFAKSQRLLSKKDFEASFDSSGVKQVCRDFVLVASRPKIGKQARLGLVVSGKVGNSVVRNRIKRSVREVFRNELAQSPSLSGRDLVVIARPTLVDQEGRVKTDLRGSLRHCVGRLVTRLSAQPTSGSS